jgi:hypothetical protein
MLVVCCLSVRMELLPWYILCYADVRVIGKMYRVHVNHSK